MGANGSNNNNSNMGREKIKNFALNMTIAFIAIFFQFFSLVLHDQQRNENSVFMYSTANDSFLMMLDAHTHRLTRTRIQTRKKNI